MLLGVLLTLVVAMLAVAYFVSDRNIVAPSVLFSAGFAGSILCALAYQGKWGFSLHFNTFLVIAGGIATFIAFSALTKHLFEQVRLRRRKGAGAAGAASGETATLGVREPATVALLILAALDVVTMVWMLVKIQAFFPDASLAEAIRKYDGAIKFSTKDLSFGSPLTQLKSLALFTGYYVCFVVAYEIHLHHVRTLKFLAAALALVSAITLSLATGGREQAICYVVTTIACFLLIRIRTGRHARLTPKTAVIALVVAAAVVAAFLVFAAVRGVQQSSTDYIAEYLGAEIHNLDHFLNNYSPHKILVWGGMTFANLLNFIGDKLHIAALNYQLDLPFLKSNGYDMGNVYTTFYAFIYDFGYAGVPILTAIMAVASQAAFEMASRVAKATRADFWITVYAYLAFQVLFCFFSNKFYENAFGDSALRFLTYVFIGRTLLLYCNRSGFAEARAWVGSLSARRGEKDGPSPSRHLKS